MLISESEGKKPGCTCSLPPQGMIGFLRNPKCKLHGDEVLMAQATEVTSGVFEVNVDWAKIAADQKTPTQYDKGVLIEQLDAIARDQSLDKAYIGGFFVKYGEVLIGMAESEAELDRTMRIYREAHPK